MSLAITLADQLSAHQKKRQALEQLISFAKQICSAGEGMDALQFITRPSQNAEKGRFLFLSQMAEHLKSLNTQELQVRLDHIDKMLVAEVELFLRVADLSEADFLSLCHQSTSEKFEQNLDDLQKRLLAFKRKAQTNVAIRLVLHERGAQLHALKLPVSQEELSRQVLDLRKKESSCRDRITNDIKSLLAATEDIMGKHKCPKQMFEKMLETQHQLHMALTHIEAGKNIEDLPIIIEVYDEIDLLPSGIENRSLPRTKTIEDTAPDPNDTKTNKKGFFSVLDKWLNSSADISWHDIKEQEKHQSSNPASKH